jgi:hypothetical protein
VLERRDVRVLGQAAHDAGMKPMEGAALELVAAGTIAPVELLRVFGARWREQGTFTE